MKKLILVLAILAIAAPAFAALDVSLVQVGSNVVIRYTGADSANLPRAFALVVSLTGASIQGIHGVSNYKIGESNSTKPGFGIYPATIAINGSGTVTDWGTPIASASDPLPTGAVQTLPSNKLVLEFGSLYAPVADKNQAPATDGNLCTLSIDCNGTGNPTITLTDESTYRGGVVLENGTTVTVNKTLAWTCSTECYAGRPDYSEWVDAGKPTCWCFPRQCHGDADGLKAGGSISGYYYVSQTDLDILISAWQVKNSPKGPSLKGNQGCADFDHLKAGGSISGYYRVSQTDLDRLIATWQVKESPKGPGVPANCLPGNRP